MVASGGQEGRCQPHKEIPCPVKTYLLVLREAATALDLNPEFAHF
jgi:hypothetical protein